MKNIKNQRKIIAIFTGLSLSTMLIACTPNKVQSTPKESDENVRKVETNNTKEKQIVEDIITQNENGENTFNEKYFDELKERLNELRNYTQDKWNSDEIVEKRKFIKQKFREIVDFVFNGKEINGITFSELKNEEKERLMNKLSELDEYIDDYIPGYKERIKNWLNEKMPELKEWLVDKGADLKELWSDYSSKVDEEYEKRQLTKHL